MIEIPVAGSDRRALVDDDHAWLLKWRWKLNKGYVVRYGNKYLPLHGYTIKGDRPDGMIPDHIDRDKFNCQSENMRWVTHSQSNANRNIPAKNPTQLRGVLLMPSGRYRAAATINKRQHYLGMYDTAEEAGEVAAKFRRVHMPFAKG